MNDVELDKQREEIIEEIKRAFPVKAPPKGLVKDRREYHSKSLLELFEGKTWVELINHPDLAYMMSDVDYIRAIKERTFIFYLPAFLITTLNDPHRTVYTNGFIEIWRIASELSIDKLQAVITCFTYQEKFWRNKDSDDREAKLFEDLALSLLVSLDKKKSKS
jgi:hypothetical protein